MRKAGFLWLLLVVILLTACAAEPKTEFQTEPVLTEKPINAGAFYASGKKAVEAANYLILDYDTEEVRTVGDSTFKKMVSGSASYQGYAQEGMLAKVEQTLDLGYYRCAYREYYFENRAYATVNDSYFWSNQSPEVFASRQLPPVLLTPALYDTIQYGEDLGTVLFSNPRNMEAWVGEGQLLEAFGQASLDEEGRLLRTTYHVKYRRGETDYSLTATVGISAPEKLDLSEIQSNAVQSSVWLSDLNTPQRLIQVVADVYSAQSLTCELRETIKSEAIPLSYIRNNRISFRGRESSLSAEVLNTSILSNNRGVITESRQTEQFQEGIYTVSVNGGAASPDDGITAISMRQYCEDTILSGLLAVKYLRGASAEADGKLLRLELDGDLVFREIMTRHLKDVLQVDLDALADVTQHHDSGGYLTLDTETGLPVEFGMFMEKSHIIDGITYKLDYRMDETLNFS